MNDLLAILKYKRLTLNLILILAALVISFYLKPLAPILFILSSNLFDILGYHFILVRRENKLPEKEIVKAYRVIQSMFDLVFLVLIGFLFGWITAITGAILKLFALQDLLYYFFLNERLPAKWNWLGFTPLGIFKKHLNTREVLLQAIIGIIISIIFFLFFWKR